jgi:hypothetical protein
MRENYNRILLLSGQPVNWYDEYGLPRFEDFSPYSCANIHLQEAVLAEISCQGCSQLFKVAISLGAIERFEGNKPLCELILSKQLHYGNPPNIGCCEVGPTINSKLRRVFEYWSFDKKDWEWCRNSFFEVDIEDHLCEKRFGT